MSREYLACCDCKEMKTECYDVIILGTGIAGLFTALSLKDDLKILLITKDKIDVNNTNLAQGGIAVTLNETSLEKHKDDTVVAGNHYNSREVVEEVIVHGSLFIDHLLKMGVNFDKDSDGKLLLTREGGHTERRILHSKDSTGKEIIRALSIEAGKRLNIEIREDTFAIDLITENNKAIGVLSIDEEKSRVTYGNHLILATGGVGKLYEKSTNEIICTGDGMAMANRAGAVLKDMEFIQFHPTALNIDGERNFLISEAVRGEGGILRNADGLAFMKNYHELKDLAPRNVTSLAVHEQMKKSQSNGVYLDVTHLNCEYIQHRFPMIYKYCLDKGIDISKEYIPITPVQHYMMGGIVTNSYGETTVNNLYACGEVANTGMHGANRMASNSLLEGLAFAGIIANGINKKIKNTVKISTNDSTSRRKLCTNKVDMWISYNMRKKIRNIMSENVGMIRNKRDLNRALLMIKDMEQDVNIDRIELDYNLVSYKVMKHYCETINMIKVAKLIVIGALNRPISLGGHVISKESRNDI